MSLGFPSASLSVFWRNSSTSVRRWLSGGGSFSSFSSSVPRHEHGSDRWPGGPSGQRGSPPSTKAVRRESISVCGVESKKRNCACADSSSGKRSCVTRLLAEISAGPCMASRWVWGSAERSRPR
eukprot:scaffold544_cov256-Pinguiococcus_pyrenoidosus.AAC.3